MDLIVLIIQLIAKALSGPKPSVPATNNPNDLVRQIQARIEAARLQEPRPPQQASSRPMMARLPPPGRSQTAPFKQRKTKRQVPPALPTKVAAPLVAKVAAVAPAAAPPPPPRPAAVNVDAKVLARWLRPQTLRAQFILTEIFQPPVALRESHLL